MQTREKNLAIALGAVVAVMGVWTVLRPWYLEPITSAEAQLTLVKMDLEKLENQQMQLLAATKQLADWKSQSLPPDPKPKGRNRPDALNGQRLYQEWLQDLARQCGFQNPEAAPSVTRAFQDVYVTAQVRLKGQAHYRQLCEFLSKFEQTELLHRIESCQIASPNYRGDPLLEINLVAEAVALQDAPQRDALFPQTELASGIKAADTKLTIKNADGFPENGRFGIRIGEEHVTVVHIKGDEWQVARGKDQTEPVAHPAGTRIDLGLYNALDAEESAREPHPRLTLIAEENPFTIPPPKTDYQPRLVLPSEQVVYLGNRLEIDARAEDLRADLGPPKFEFVGEVPQGMTMEPVPEEPLRQRITWSPDDKSLIDTYTISIQANREDFASPIKQSMRVVVRDRNYAPELESIPGQLVYSGQPLNFRARATDRNADQKLTYSLGSNAPAEATIDPATGEFSWTPPGLVTEQKIDLEIVVTDDGNPSEKDAITVPIEVKADVAHFTRFVGSVSNGGRGEAWLFDRWNKRDYIIRVGEVLDIADITAELVDVQPDVLIFKRGSESWKLERGKDIREMTRHEAVTTAKTESSDQ